MTLVQTEPKKIYIRVDYQPWANCVAWYKLENDAKDYSWNNNDATWTWTANYTTVWGEVSANFDTSRYLTTPITIWSWPITIACMFYYVPTSWGTYYTVMWWPYSRNGSSNPHLWTCIKNLSLTNNVFYHWAWKYNENSESWTWITWNTWHFCAIRIDSNRNIKINTDTTQTTGTTNAFTINDVVYIGAWVWNKFNWNIKQAAIWNTSISDAELEEYRTAVMGWL